MNARKTGTERWKKKTTEYNEKRHAEKYHWNMFELGSSFFLSRVTFLTFRRHLCMRRAVRATARAIFSCFFFRFVFQFGAFNMYIARYWLTLILCGLAQRRLCSICCFLVADSPSSIFSLEQAHIVKYVLHKCMWNEIEYYADDDDDD